MSSVNIAELLKQEAVDIDGKFLTASTLSDGYTGTYQGNHLYRVTKEGVDYTVVPVDWDNYSKKFVDSDNPIIATQGGDTVFFVVNTTNEPYLNAGIQEETIKPEDVLEKQVLQAFLAFVADEFKLGIYNVFLTEEPSVQ